MKVTEPTPKEEASITSKWVMVTFVLLGLVLILASIAIPHENIWRYISDFLKELGTVILAVFTVSLLYELLVAEKYVKHFLNLLRSQIGEGESNAAACVKLGIVQIFPTRDIFEMENPITSLTATLGPGSNLRIVAQSLLHLMNNPEVIRNVIQQGAKVELCIFDPDSPSAEIEKHPDLVVSDIHSTISLFKKEIEAWIKEVKPPGGVELKVHRVLIFDSYLSLQSPSHNLSVWDLGFGRGLTAHRIFLLDPMKPLGADLSHRYNRIWQEATSIFKYDGQTEAIEPKQEQLQLSPGNKTEAIK